ncbi:hypothetical protein HELRODRAFT_65885, partial [Helobdella robusta]|uniref:E2F-associated phosphoprotein n=1 Tax=Helobdella robusta TaxID=6412 RepID=T1FYE1_HELRO
HGATPKKKKQQNKLEIDEVSSSTEDEFELEMSEELNDEMKKFESCQPDSQNKSGSSNKAGMGYYNNIYFDSDDEASSDGMYVCVSEKKKNHPVLTNDELLYDPDMDEEDQRWVNKQRRKYQPTKSGSNKKSLKLPNSDAVLNCPCCMILLCLDCQRHSMYNSQYRAMFVTNCRVIRNEVLKYSLKDEKNKSKKQKKNGRTASVEETNAASNDNNDNREDGDDGEHEMYHPVHCEACNTEVAVFDRDEVFHFFNVLASHS